MVFGHTQIKHLNITSIDYRVYEGQKYKLSSLKTKSTSLFFLIYNVHSTTQFINEMQHRLQFFNLNILSATAILLLFNNLYYYHSYNNHC
jgi:hypothetical protein